MLDNVPDWIATDRGMLKGPIPDIRIGPQCRNPYDCEFLPFCTPPQPDQLSTQPALSLAS